MLWKSKEKKQLMIASKNVEVREKAIYSSMNFIMHCLLQLILTRWRWSNIMMMRSDKNERNKISTQLLNTISHDWEKSYSLSYYWRWRVRWVLMQALRQWIIAYAAWRINSWRWREAKFIMQSCFSLKQYLHLWAHSMRTQHVWIIIALRQWMQW